MVRPKKSDDASGPKRTRSRFGCWPCKARKVKCGEEKPICKNCERQGEACDYKVRLNWSHAGSGLNTIDFSSQSVPTTPSIVFPAPEVFSGKSTPNPPLKSPGLDEEPRKSFKLHGRSRSNVSTPVRDLWDVDPALKQNGKGASGMLTVDDSGIRNGSYGSLTSGGAAFDQQPTAISPGGPIYSPESRTLPNIVLNSSATMPITPSMFPGISPSHNTPVRHNSDGYFEGTNRNKRQRLSNYGGPGGGAYDAQQSQPSTGSIDLQLNTASSGAPATSNFTFEPSPMNVSPHYEQSRSSVPVSFLLEKSPSRQNSAGNRDPHSIEFRISPYRSYGYDTGQPDRDVDHNDDLNAIVGSPAIAQGSSFDNPETETLTFALDNYYENPVQINIPKTLEPLPEQLQTNAMDLLYFHHFINHVARILTPHDCPANPYRTIIPKMAIHDPDLLNLILAYSACHRARLLAHPEPKVRILRYVANVFSRLAEAFRSPEIVSEKHIATAIMLCSLEIVSPQAFEHRIPWHTYLNMARDMFKQRRDARGPQTTFNADMYFLCRWYGYLDIMGSMSGAHRPEPLDFDVYWVTNPNEPDDTIDCLLGCTMHCMQLLGKAAKLIKESQPARFDPTQDKVRQRWQASHDQCARARSLIQDLLESSERRVTTCPHEAMNSPRPLEAPHSTDLKELMSVNIIYHWAGIIQLHRRVLNTPQDSSEVRAAIEKVLELLGTMRAGSPAEACMLFPIFSAGCEARDHDLIAAFRRRTEDISRLGMRQVDEAVEIMEKAWDQNNLWENIVKNEFIG